MKGNYMKINLKKLFRKKDDLRDYCRKLYGDEFVEDYDKLNNGEPIGNLAETVIFLNLVDYAKQQLNKQESI